MVGLRHNLPCVPVDRKYSIEHNHYLQRGEFVFDSMLKEREGSTRNEEGFEITIGNRKAKGKIIELLRIPFTR